MNVAGYKSHIVSQIRCGQHQPEDYKKIKKTYKEKLKFNTNPEQQWDQIVLPQIQNGFNPGVIFDRKKNEPQFSWCC